MKSVVRSSLLWLLLSLNFCLQAKSSPDYDLLNLEQNSPHDISVGWTFFWKNLIDPTTPFVPISDGIKDVAVPSYWTDYKINGTELPRFGYGSYSKYIVLSPSSNRQLGIYVPSVDVAYSLFINGKLVASCGKVGTNEQQEVPEYEPKLIEYIATADTLHFVFHVSNFHHRRGGIWKKISIGPYQELLASYKSDYFFDLISLGILISFGFFFLVFSFYYRAEKSIFYLSMCFLFIFLRGICTNFYPIGIIAPTVSWERMIRLEYISNFVSLIMGSWGFFYLNPIKWVRKMLFGLTILLIPIFAAILFLPVHSFAFTIYMFYFLLVFCICLLTYQIFTFVAKGKAVSFLYLAGIVLLIMATINDILVSNSVNFVFKFYILPRVFLVFILILSIEFFRRFVATYKHEKELSNELAKLNLELQQKVEDRTSQIQEKSKIIESQNELLQKDIQLKNRILSIIGHDIRSPLSFVVMGLDLISDKNLPEKNRASFIQKIVFAANNLFLLVDNLLSWGMSQNKQLKIVSEEIDLSMLTESVIDNFLFVSENKELKFAKDIPMNITAWFDSNTITIVIRNLLSNALKFTPRNGIISIAISETTNEVIVRIADNGIGIPPEKLDQINKGINVVSSAGTDQEKGTGLGLILCKELVTLNGGVFSATSKPGAGSTFSFTLPKNKPE